jgi:hypothetical protein
VPAPRPASPLAPLVAIAAVALVTCGSAGVYFASRPAGSQTAAPTVRVPPVTVPKQPPLRIADSHQLLFARTDPPLLLVPFSIAQQTHYGIFDAQSGALRSKTEALRSSLYQIVGSVQGTRLLLADDAGQLAAYAVEDGKKQWTTTLGDRVERFCTAPGAQKLRLKMKDARVVEIDLASGAQAPVGSRDCSELAATRRAASELVPGRHPDSSAPVGIEAHSCGGMRVMGSTNFVVPDQCRPRLRMAPDNVQGMQASAIWRHGNGWILIGRRSAGTQVPMLGWVREGSVGWTANVPSGNPLEATAGRPAHVVLAGGLVAASYQMSSSRGRLTAFELQSGRRAWEIDVPSEVGQIKQLAASSGALFAVGNSRLVAIDAATGKRRFTIGQ